jgi:WD40 repeat protein/serine/threonine protein kinase
MNANNQTMPSDPQREAALFQAASQLTGPARSSFLDAACGDDSVLRRRLEALLGAHDQSEGLLAEPAAGARGTLKIEFTDPPDEAVGQKIGRYKILEKVGEGGWGVVYVAEQTEPVRRRVALKVIKLGMDTKAVVARFEAERQALAMMDHPNIARVLDAGSTETGRPYFVMELVRGIKITDYCDQNNLPTLGRLALFIKICQAIQHAHQKGIIHRDIKPSNILVTLHDGVPVPKVIDFGIAKATEGRLTDATVYTQLHQFIGTPAYMSPEQAEMSGLDIDTRSDIYSLGVLLYELLTGKTPFDANELMSQGIDEMRKTIREKDPVRPSTKLATLQAEELTTTAKRRSVDRSKLLHQLKGDLDWIVMKCLEKDRTRRYETANGLAFDIKRHLNNETVVARPPSSAYRFQKAFRRNKLVFAAAGAVLCALVLGIIATTWQSVRATLAKKQALAAQAQEAVQRQAAEANEQKAVAAQKAEAAEELIARQRAYASDMNVAKQALDANNLGRALDLLKRQIPQGNEKDLRGWEWRYLWQQTRSDALFTVCQQSNEIESLVVSADGKWLATGIEHKDGLFVYDLQTRQQVARLVPGENYVRAAFSPTEPLLAFASTKTRNTLHLWNAATRKMTGEFPLEDDCAGLAFSEDGRTLVTATIGNITVWSVSDGAKLHSYPTSDLSAMEVATSFAATADLSLAAYASFPTPERLRVVDLRNGKELWSAPASKQHITALAFSSDGKTLASAAGFDESDIRLWDVATGKPSEEKFEGHDRFVSSLVFWPDGKKLASSSGDQTIRIWDVASRKCLDVLHGHHLEVWRLALLPDNKTLLSASKDGQVCAWDTSVTHPRQARITIPGGTIYNWRFSPDSQSILTLDSNAQLTRWSGPDFQQREPLVDIKTNLITGRWWNTFSSDGRFLAFGYTNGVLQVWDVSRHSLRRQWTNTSGSVYPLEFIDGGSKLITGSQSDGLVHQWDLVTGRELQSWKAASSGFDIPNSTDDERFVDLGRNGKVQIKNLANGQVTNRNLDFLEGDDAAFSPDRRLFAVASHIGYARVWDTSTWKEPTTLRGYLVGLCSVTFSPDGRRLATGSDKQEALRLWDTESWQDVLTLEGDGASFGVTAFSPDGNTIGSMNYTGTLHLWRAPSWDEIHAAEAKDKMTAQTP